MTLPCPSGPEWALDWEALCDALPELRALEDCPQDPRHHAEGNVGIHTRMVLEELLALPAWRELTPQARELTFWGAALHDLAKPQCTRLDANGRVTSRGHPRRGALLARRLLWERGVPFAAREQICALVLHHMLPGFLLERPDSERLAVKACLEVPARLLALVAEADCRGREAADRDGMLERVALYRAFCREQGLWAGEPELGSGLDRYRYLCQGDPRGTRRYDDTWGEVVLLSGLPGAGKDRWASEHASDRPVVSLDALRRSLGIAPSANQGPILQAARELALGHLRAERPFVWNATNLDRQRRRALVELFAGYRARVRVVYVEAPASRLWTQNRAREHAVPEPILRRYLERWEVPQPHEAHAVDYVTPE
ncbi:MAG: AAA family ATPase [Planctomycetes bacterium]|nr:AAA family ATPase [Planctomycetota bacterium]